MAVTERLMAAGQWDLALDATTPKAIRDRIDYFGHIFIFDTPMRAGMSDAVMIASARWGGIVRIKSTAWNVGGVNMIAWLGDEDGKGPILETNIGGGGNTFAQYMTAILLQCVAVTAGTATAVAGNKATIYGITSTARQALDHLSSTFGAEYKVNKNWTIDTAPVGSTAMFAQTPTVIAMQRSSGRDQSIIGISVTQLDVSIDAEEYITRAIVHNAGGAYVGATGTVTPYKDGYANLVVLKKMFEEPNTAVGDSAAHAATLVAAGEVLRKGIILKSDDFAITRFVIPGDNIWVYDADGSMVDTANQVRYRGSFVYPVTLRALAITWPIERGMGVWYRDSAGAWTDLTNFVLFESPGASFEVGAPVRPLTKS